MPKDQNIPFATLIWQNVYRPVCSAYIARPGKCCNQGLLNAQGSARGSDNILFAPGEGVVKAMFVPPHIKRADPRMILKLHYSAISFQLCHPGTRICREAMSDAFLTPKH